jgi:uncharacterized protein with NRDE domain
LNDKFSIEELLPKILPTCSNNIALFCIFIIVHFFHVASRCFMQNTNCGKMMVAIHALAVRRDYMCIIFLAYDSHPKYRLIVAANRDEVYSRPTLPVHFWEDHPHILAGRDQLQCGTWMGITRNGRFAALTNYRDPFAVKEDAKSRGELVTKYLIGSGGPLSYLEEVRKKKHEYNGFNLLVGDLQDLYYYSPQVDQMKRLKQGIYGLSNAQLDTPWPKVQKGKKMLDEIMRREQAELKTERLFALLANVEQPSDEFLPSTGVGIDWERTLSPIFIVSPNYGTRSSSVLTVCYDQKVQLTEHTFQNGKSISHVHFSFYLQKSVDLHKKD